MVSTVIAELQRAAVGPYLPKELQGAHKRPRPHFPSVHICPLVQQKRQVPVALNPLCKHMVDDGLTGRPHYQGLF